MNTPSIKTIMANLRIEKSEAEAIKTLMTNSRTPYKTLTEIDKILENHGVEYVHSETDSTFILEGLEYSSAGDTYNCTVIYDHGRGRWYCCTLGDIVERDYKRFG